MKLKGNKRASNAAVIMSVIFIAFLVCLLIFLLNNLVKEKIAVQNQATVAKVNSSSEVKTAMTTDIKKTELINNNFDISDTMDSYGKEVTLSYEATKIKNNDSSESTCLLNTCTFYYYFTGINKGKLIAFDTKTQKEVEIKTDKKIKNIAGYSESVGTEFERIKVGKTILLKSTLYILFEDGTVGKLESNKFRNNDYTITKMPEFQNEEYFIEISPINMGGGNYLFVVNTNGEAKFLGTEEYIE